MLRRVAARGGSLRHVSRAAQNRLTSPLTTLTKVGGRLYSARRIATGKGGNDWIFRPRAMMSSRFLTSSRITETGTYLDFTSEPDIDFEHISSNISCKKFHDSVWGFVIYRCSQGNQTAWARLLQALRAKVQEDLRFYIREDMMKLHDLHVIDDKMLYGATSHQVRDHFQSWVPKNLVDRLRPGSTDPQDDVDWLRAASTPRYEYCLFADDLCLESMDHPGFNSPVVKLLQKNWESPFPPHERNYKVPAPFHDGATEYHEEDVGWMYMPLQEYLYKYHVLGKGDWDDQYVRPPYIDGSEEESEFVGHWRRDASREEV